MYELIFIGTVVVVLSGFFGIGGGTILVPMLLFLGFDIKSAIGISIVQMLFSSVFGSYINNKKGTLNVIMITYIGVGGFIGALFSGLITSSISDKSVEIIFLTFAIFAFFRLFFKTIEHNDIREVSSYILLFIGIFIGMMSMTIGVGGSIILVPILVGFLHIPLKNATSAGLFFVVFSSLAGFISHSYSGHIDYKSGIIIGLASLVGVYSGIYLKHKVSDRVQKALLVTFYLLIVLYLLKRVFIEV